MQKLNYYSKNHMEHTFTANIRQILHKHFGKKADEVYALSQLIQYINEKTRSAGRGSKARSSFASLYALYVVIEDYLEHGYDKKTGYSGYEGAYFQRLFTRQRKLPFGEKLQNHALNNRMNAEFQKYFPNSEFIPILRNLETKRYWINENLLKISINSKYINIAKAVIEIIDEYIQTKQDAFKNFIKSCEQLLKIHNKTPEKVKEFILSLAAPNVDARLFEITGYAILKYYYNNKKIIWGFEGETLQTDSLKLFKTGRTNANDGGIDFVMRPLGRFFQVTETLDFKKYFLDIDKVEKYPITFVIKSNETISQLEKKIRENAFKSYSIKAIVEKYMSCVEEIINIPLLSERFNESVKQGYLKKILNEIIVQSKVEFNYVGDDADDIDGEEES